MSVHNWRGLKGLVQHARDPLAVFVRYYCKAGRYPYQVRLRTPVGPISLELHSHDDFITVHEIFFREDYRIPKRSAIRTVVDMGANIGIASAYFLTRNDQTQVYAYEPVPGNVAKARRNLAPFGERLDLMVCAVGTEAGTVAFGVEPTGRYGGIGLPHLEQIEVSVRDGAGELARIQAGHGRIDVLKIDVEDLEIPIIKSLPSACLRNIGTIVAECDGSDLALPGFTYDQYLSVARFQADT